MPPIEQFHPMVVHFPIVFMLSLAAFDLVAIVRGAPVGGRNGTANVSAGLATLSGLGALAAYSLGDLALDIAEAAGAPTAPLELHETFGSVTVGVIVVWSLIRAVIWWRQVPLAGGRAIAVTIVEIAIALLVLITAYYGGSLVYEYGVGVSREALAIPH